MEKKRKINIFQKTFQNTCQRQKSLLLLHPLNERIADLNKRHVPRHIELTAVFKRDLKNKNKESKRIERLEKTTRI